MNLSISETEKKWKVCNKVDNLEIEYVFSKVDFPDKKNVEEEMKRMLEKKG